MAATKAISIISVPSDLGSVIKGKSLAPEAILSAGFSKKLESIGYEVHECNALPDGPATWSNASKEPNGVRDEDANVTVFHKVKATVSEALGVKESAPPFLAVLGGECCMVPAIMSAIWHRLAPKRIGLLYIDGDCDLALPTETSSSGNLASMTMTHLALRPGALESMKSFSRPDGSGVIDSSNLVLFGLNSALQSNRRDQLGYLFDEGYRVFTSAAVAKDPAGRAKQALQWLEERVDCILLHLDVDAIDPSRFPLANVPNWTGAGFDEIMAAMKVFLSSEKVRGLVIAEVNPDHDPGSRMTIKLVDGLIGSFPERLDKAVIN